MSHSYVLAHETAFAQLNISKVNSECKSGCSTRRCGCVKAELKCTGLCGCNSCVIVDEEDNNAADDGNDEFDADGMFD